MSLPGGNWKPTLSVMLSILILVGCISVSLWQPEQWPWAFGIVFINHMYLTIAGLIPRSTILGANITRLPIEAAQRREVAITIDDGPDPEVTPKTLDILDRYQVKATFFCIGKVAARYPELCHEIIRRGHEIENHSLSHQWFFPLLDPWTTYREVHEAQNVLYAISGRKPYFFRAVAGLRNPQLELVLAQCNLRLCSWTRRGFDTRVKDADHVLQALLHNLKAGDILLLHDGNAALTAKGQPVILDVLPRLLQNIAKAELIPVTLRSAIP